MLSSLFLLFFFFNDTATTEIYTLSLHDALPIYSSRSCRVGWSRRRRTHPRRSRWPTVRAWRARRATHTPCWPGSDRKSTRLNSSHANISYAVFCLKKKKNTQTENNSEKI